MMKTKSDFLDFFNQYTKSFIENIENYDVNIILKIEHTYRVLETTTFICQKMDLSKDLCFLAELIAIFHDLGRFEQFKQYKTYSDPISFNHAEKAVEIIQNLRLLNDLPKKSQKLLIEAIKLHNVIELPYLSGNQKLLCQIIRDADKLDIFHILLNHLQKNDTNEIITLHLINDKNKYSQHFPDKIINNELIDYRDQVFINDMFITVIGWVKQLYFDASISSYKKHQYHKKIAEYLPLDEKISSMLNHLDDYLNNF